MTIKDVTGGRGVYPSGETRNSKATKKADSLSPAQQNRPPVETGRTASSDKMSLSNLKQPNIEQLANEALLKVKSKKLEELGSIARKIGEGYFDKEPVRADTANKIFKDVGRLEAAFTAMQRGELQRLDKLQKMDLSAHSGNPEVMRTTAERIVQDLKKL